MSVTLRGCNIGVTQQLLHRTQIGTAVEQMRCEAVSQGVRMCRDWRATIDDPPDIAGREILAALVAEQDATRPTRRYHDNVGTKRQPGVQRSDSWLAERYPPLLSNPSPRRLQLAARATATPR